MLFEASAPGSLMLLGEYAVLHGKTALVCALDKRITVRLKPRLDDKIHLSSALGEYFTDRFNINVIAPFQFVLSVLKKFQNKLPAGCDLDITSEFSSQVGFASSAAVTAATLAAVNEWLMLSLSPLELARVGRVIIRNVQGQGSGADVAACVYGGVIAFCAKPFSIEKLPHQYPLTVLYSGAKTTTVNAISIVKQTFSSQPALFQDICRGIGRCAQQGRDALYANNWAEFGKIMNIQQGFMDALGVNTPTLQGLIDALRADERILGAKISGSGLGDCVIGLGSIPEGAIISGQRIAINVTNQGVVCEKK